MSVASRWLICRWQIALLALCILSFGAATNAKADQDQSIRLLSDETADACIQDVACMRDLFVRAAFGEGLEADAEALPLFKWNGPVQIGSFFGEGIDDPVQQVIRQSLAQMHLLGRIAGSDLSLAKANGSDVINFILLISDNFSTDRDRAFSTLLSSVFGGHVALYDELSSGPSPVCKGHLFAETKASVSGGLGLVDAGVDAAVLGRCLHQAVLNVLGLRYQLPETVDSVLNPTSQREAWTSVDFLLLKMLHDPALRPGMTRAEVTAMFTELHKRALSPSS
ncbi:MAG: DUF2927 domain-containing protein [Pseudomonadota bacterium]